MKGDTRCEDGRVMRHDPQHDDPYLETDIGKCPECEGNGCKTYCDCCSRPFPRDQVSHCFVTGIETFACDECRGANGL